jgi:hypothetical protein
MSRRWRRDKTRSTSGCERSGSADEAHEYKIMVDPIRAPARMQGCIRAGALKHRPPTIGPTHGQVVLRCHPETQASFAVAWSRTCEVDAMAANVEDCRDADFLR